MDWRSILKFDENLYNHTDESTKEKHQRILDFIKDRPKTKGTGLRIKQFLDSGELDESFTPLDLPRNSITQKTKEFYEKFTHPDELGGDRFRFFGDVKNSVNDLVTTFSNMFRIYRVEIQREMGGMPIRDFTLAFSKLVKNFYYSELPNAEDLHGSFQTYIVGVSPYINYENTPAYKETVQNYLNKFEPRGSDLLLHVVERALEYLLPTSTISTRMGMDIRQDLGRLI